MRTCIQVSEPTISVFMSFCLILCSDSLCIILVGLSGFVGLEFLCVNEPDPLVDLGYRGSEVMLLISFFILTRKADINTKVHFYLVVSLPPTPIYRSIMHVGLDSVN